MIYNKNATVQLVVSVLKKLFSLG